MTTTFRRHCAVALFSAVFGWTLLLPLPSLAGLQAATGEVVETEADFTDTGAHPLHFTRHYRSSGNAVAGLGPAWSHNWMAFVVASDNGATVHFGSGNKDIFVRGTAPGTWAGGRNKLVETPAGLLLLRASDDSQWQFDANRRLVAVTQRNGWRATLAYNAAGQLERVTNAFGRALVFMYDAAGHLAAVTPPDNATIAFAFDGAGRLASASLGDGNARQYGYTSAHALTTLSFNGMPTVTYGYDANGRASSMQQAGVATRSVVTYPSGFSTSARLIAGKSVDPSIYLATIQVTDANGNAVTQTLQGGDGRIRVVGSSSPGADPMAARTLGEANLPAVETDYLGVQTTKQWDASRELLVATTEAANTPQARTTTTTWHPQFRLPLQVQEPGRTTSYEYDAAGNKVGEQVTDAVTGTTRSTRCTYAANNLLASMTDAAGRTWTYSHDAAGNRTSITDPQGGVTRFTHDGAGRVLTRTDPGGLRTAFVYDGRGRVLAETRGTETRRYTYTSAGLLASAVLPDGYAVNYSYDAAQRLTGASDNRGAVVSYTLDAAGNRVREEIRDAAGSIALATRRVVNSLNQVVAIQGAAGPGTQFGYDANGELVTQSDPLNQATRQTLDALRRTTATTFADDNAAVQSWTALDQLARLTDPKGVATVYTYNAFGEVLTETSPDIGTIEYTRDAGGQVIAKRDAKGQLTQFERDALGRITTTRHADGTQATFRYDEAGHLERMEDRSGATSFERDAQGRITRRTQDVNDNPAAPSRFRIDYAWANGALERIAYPSGLKVSYVRSNGRIVRVDVQEPGGTVKRPKPIDAFITGLAHTALGQPKSWTWSNGDSAARSFDADGRMTATEFASYLYDAAGRMTGITQNLWMAVANADGSLAVSTTPIAWQAGYDNRNRLVSFTRDGSETRYTYDANSNRLTATDKTTSDTDLDGEFDAEDFSKTTSQALKIGEASNRLLGFTQGIATFNNGKTRTQASTTVQYTVDANGSLTSDGLREFDYGADGRLQKVRAVKDGEAASIRYLVNASGQRVFKGEPVAEQTVPDETALGVDFVAWLKKQFAWLFTQAAANTSIGTAYVYGDGELPGWALLGEYDNGSASGKGRTEYIWLPTEDGGAIPVGLYRSGQFFAIHTDHLGTPRLMTNEAKKVVWQWPYSAFGENKPTGMLKATPNPKSVMTNKPVLLKATGAMEMNLRLPGQYFDAESGWSQNGKRDYDSRMGRYRQADPTGLRGGPNRVTYADLDPLQTVDPTGEVGFLLLPQFWLAAGAVAGAAVAGGSHMLATTGPGWGWVSHPDAAAEHEAYKKRSREQPPPDFDECERLKWLLKREQDVVHAMQMWDLKWNRDGRHAEAIRQRQRAIEKLKKQVESACGECK